eukprot:scaffold361_cov248-Pinguiococcus_pyrenoidosus.AAC.32
MEQRRMGCQLDAWPPCGGIPGASDGRASRRTSDDRPVKVVEVGRGHSPLPLPVPVESSPEVASSIVEPSGVPSEDAISSPVLPDLGEHLSIALSSPCGQSVEQTSATCGSHEASELVSQRGGSLRLAIQKSLMDQLGYTVCKLSTSSLGGIEHCPPGPRTAVAQPFPRFLGHKSPCPALLRPRATGKAVSSASGESCTRLRPASDPPQVCAWQAVRKSHARRWTLVPVLDDWCPHALVRCFLPSRQAVANGIFGRLRLPLHSNGRQESFGMLPRLQQQPHPTHMASRRLPLAYLPLPTGLGTARVFRALRQRQSSAYEGAAFQALP